MTFPAGSPLWQMVMLWVAVLFLIWSIWRGWRAGVVRAALKVAAITGSVYIGYGAAVIVAAPLGGLKNVGGAATGIVIGLAVALTAFVVFWILSVLLFKRTDQQKPGVFRFLWGLGGAFFGGLLALFILWGAVSLIRFTGSIAEAQLKGIADAQTPMALNRPLRALGPSHPSPAEKSGVAYQILDQSTKLKKSLELGPVGQSLVSVDPIPSEAYEVIQEGFRVIVNPQAMQRLAQYPPIKHVMQNPKITELLNDPAFLQAAEDKNMQALMSNPALLNSVKDPAFVAEIEKIDLRAALKFALATPSPSPAPYPPAKNP